MNLYFPHAGDLALIIGCANAGDSILVNTVCEVLGDPQYDDFGSCHDPEDCARQWCNRCRFFTLGIDAYYPSRYLLRLPSGDEAMQLFSTQANPLSEKSSSHPMFKHLWAQFSRDLGTS